MKTCAKEAELAGSYCLDAYISRYDLTVALLRLVVSTKECIHPVVRIVELLCLFLLLVYHSVSYDMNESKHK
eukprot:1157893-Pelagomonas_calceolata.AAC.4